MRGFGFGFVAVNGNSWRRFFLGFKMQKDREGSAAPVSSPSARSRHRRQRTSEVSCLIFELVFPSIISIVYTFCSTVETWFMNLRHLGSCALMEDEH